MTRQKGQSAAAWFYGAPGFHSTTLHITLSATPLPLVWVCCQCVADGLTQPPDPTRYRRTDGLCGPHMDLMRIPIWQRKAQRAEATR